MKTGNIKCTDFSRCLDWKCSTILNPDLDFSELRVFAILIPNLHCMSANPVIRRSGSWDKLSNLKPGQQYLGALVAVVRSIRYTDYIKYRKSPENIFLENEKIISQIVGVSKVCDQTGDRVPKNNKQFYILV